METFTPAEILLSRDDEDTKGENWPTRGGVTLGVKGRKPTGTAEGATEEDGIKTEQTLRKKVLIPLNLKNSSSPSYRKVEVKRRKLKDALGGIGEWDTRIQRNNRDTLVGEVTTGS